MDNLGLANEALVDEGGERGRGIEPVACCISVSAAAKVQPPANTPNRRNSTCSLGSEQVVAPGNGIAQRLLPRGKIPGTTGQQRQAPLEAASSSAVRRQHLDARRRQLDGQG